MDPIREHKLLQTRRHFFGRMATGIGVAALGSLFHPGLVEALADENTKAKALRAVPPFAPTAKRVIYLFMAGGPSQIELLDYKPGLNKLHETELPESVRMGQRITTMTSGQKSLPVVKSLYQFKQYGRSGTWVSELLPHTAGIVDDICIVKTVNTEAINHDPAITFIQTGFQQPGRPCMGAWLSYGLGTANANLPTFVVMISSGKDSDQPLYTRLWSAGFLPSEYQGVQFRGKGDPVLYLGAPPGISRQRQRDVVQAVNAINTKYDAIVDDPEIAARIAQYEMAFRMQASVPELMDSTQEPRHILELYGCQPGDGSFASNCLLARRLAERGVRFIQLYHKDWDHHGGVKDGVSFKAQEVDRACMALITDLKQHGMLDDTLIVWAGEFGRTPMSQGGDGRDHHNAGFSIWLCGGGIKAGLVFGATDELGYNAVENPVDVHDLHATMLRLLGIEHTRLTVKFQGLDARLTNVSGKVIGEILA